MKYVLVSIALFLSACASSEVSRRSASIRYSDLANIEIGISSEKNITALFGKPSSRRERDGQFTLVYNDLETDYQRLSIGFSSSDKKVISVLWIPFEGEAELSVAGAKSHFKNSNFNVEVTVSKNPHFYSEMTSYTDEFLGVTILCAENKKHVQAIARYDVTKKSLSTAHKEPEIKYTIGDELISK